MASWSLGHTAGSCSARTPWSFSSRQLLACSSLDPYYCPSCNCFTFINVQSVIWLANTGGKLLKVAWWSLSPAPAVLLNQLKDIQNVEDVTVFLSSSEAWFYFSASSYNSGNWVPWEKLALLIKTTVKKGIKYLILILIFCHYFSLHIY